MVYRFTRLVVSRFNPSNFSAIILLHHSLPDGQDCFQTGRDMASSTISFSFPGWDFEGKEERATAAPAAYDWLEDLDELQGDEAEASSAAADAAHATEVVAAEAGAGANWLGSAEWPDDIAHAVLSHLDLRALSDARACCLHWKR